MTDTAQAQAVRSRGASSMIARDTCARATRFGLALAQAGSRSTAMKLTPELIQSVPSQLNPTKERQLDLRGALRSRRLESLTRVLAHRIHHPCHRKSWYYQGA